MECDHKQFTDEAVRFVRTLSPSTEGATIVALHGDLGAGKTTFVQAIARAGGVTEEITSPTFVIQKSYPVHFSESATTTTTWDTLVHIDAYRLESAHELEVLDWERTCANPKNIIFIEWPEHVAELLTGAHHIYFTYTDEHTRSISYE